MVNLRLTDERVSERMPTFCVKLHREGHLSIRAPVKPPTLDISRALNACNFSSVNDRVEEFSRVSHFAVSVGTREPLATQAYGNCAATMPACDPLKTDTARPAVHKMRPAVSISPLQLPRDANAGGPLLDHAGDPAAECQSSGNLLATHAHLSHDQRRMKCVNNKAGQGRPWCSGQGWSSSNRLHSVSTGRSIHKKSGIRRSISMDAAIAFFQNALAISNVQIEEAD
eukprot:jgi/Ulvmu1/11613/UM008_0014.1